MTGFINDSIVTWASHFVHSEVKQQGANIFCFHTAVIMEKVKVIILLLITSTQAVKICEGKNALNVFCLTFKSEEMWKKANMWRILVNNTIASIGSAKTFRHQQSLKKEISYCELFHNVFQVASLVHRGTQYCSDYSSLRRTANEIFDDQTEANSNRRKNCLHFSFSNTFSMSVHHSVRCTWSFRRFLSRFLSSSLPFCHRQPVGKDTRRAAGLSGDLDPTYHLTNDLTGSWFPWSTIPTRSTDLC